MDDAVDSMDPIALRQKIEDILEPLTGAERAVIKHRYGLEEGFTRTIEEVAVILGITPEQARLIESRAIARLWPDHDPAA